MQNHDESNEPRLSAERMASLDYSRAPRAEVEDRIVGALRGNSVLRNDRDALAMQAAYSGRRSVWVAGLAAAAATVMFFAGVKVGEGRSNATAAGALASNPLAVHALGTTCPAAAVAAIPEQSQLIWY